MASIWSRNTENVIKTPGLWAFGSVLFAWLAGFELRDLIFRVRMHNSEPLVSLDYLVRMNNARAPGYLDYLVCPALLLGALLWSYQVVRTIRQLSAGRPTSPSPVQTK